MLTLDLNADLAEGAAYDHQLLQCISSANISCGWHAGELKHLRAALDWAGDYGVAIGAHPSFPDKEHQGRRPMQLPLTQVQDCLLYQLGALQALCLRHQQRLRHVKPHGALYNQAATDPELADCIADAIQQFDRQLLLFGLAGSELLRAGQRHGLTTVAEGFADRAYHTDGTLVPRTCAGAVLSDPEQIVHQSLQLARESQVTTLNGTRIPIKIASLCLHGDHPSALVQAQAVNRALREQGIRIAAP